MLSSLHAYSENGYDLWLRYSLIENEAIRTQYTQFSSKIRVAGNSPTINALKSELMTGLNKMLDITPQISSVSTESYALIIATISNLPDNADITGMPEINDEGYIIMTQNVNGNERLIVTARTDIGLLYGTFNLLQLMQQQRDLQNIEVASSPRINLRLLNHWDNLDRTVERGYAGASIWNWQKLPEYIDQRYIDYARANASIGINGTVVTNVNANALILTPQYVDKVKALADVFRPYGIKVYLTARFSAPVELGDLDTADPLDPAVQEWWNVKANEIYNQIPDFGGFLVKANSEGQPGPQNYGRNHVDGANMLAAAVKPHGGIVMWRAFVYSPDEGADRASQASKEFVPYDGQFAENVLVQVKNGPIDFQPREPFHPMFGAMPKTPLMMEFQITQEYLGFSTHLVFLPKLFQEVLHSRTYQPNRNTRVADIIAGTEGNQALTGMAGVANIGSDINWTGHIFGQANWFGFGKLAWDPDYSLEQIAEEWLKMTFTPDPEFVNSFLPELLESREMPVSYMTPLGLHHMMDAGHHYGPGPWISNMSRPDWTSVYYHKADKSGIGFDRTTTTGSGAVNDYAPELAKLFNDPATTPEELLLWFHHLPWTYKLKNGRTLWDNLGMKYQEGVDEVGQMLETWKSLRPYVDEERYEEILMHLNIQFKEAKWWKNACMLYFQEFSEMPFPPEMTVPDKDLSYYKSLKFPYAPGIRPSWD
nr:alpha-glucuronidase family glycosyl hydrolase [Fulvivirga sedimenti]